MKRVIIFHDACSSSSTWVKMNFVVCCCGSRGEGDGFHQVIGPLGNCCRQVNILGFGFCCCQQIHELQRIRRQLNKNTVVQLDSNRLDVKLKLDLNWTWTELELDSNWTWTGLELDSNWIRTGFELDSNWIRTGLELDSNWTWTGLDLTWLDLTWLDSTQLNWTHFYLTHFNST
jgi:hypothetical protein